MPNGLGLRYVCSERSDFIDGFGIAEGGGTACPPGSSQGALPGVARALRSFGDVGQIRREFDVEFHTDTDRREK